ncbi:MAG: phospho-N-acetylmuramoyl-pentapeptide-transferase [Victivallaceae bacterium]|nr:phospho-N-acetylmuramoyl-pentapeptide-transferase [Victivallaceae bacterium]
MLTFLADWQNAFGPLRLFNSLTFCAGGAGFTAFLIVVLFGRKTAAALRKLNLRAADRYEGLMPPEYIDKVKNSTPCMGGLLLIGGILLSSLLWINLTDPIALVLMGATLGFAGIGFADDYLKTIGGNRDGISAKLKFLLQLLVAGFAVAMLHILPETREVMRGVAVPFLKENVSNSPYVAIALSLLVIVGASNAVNLTDGKDGLATGCTIFCALTYAVFAYLMGHRIFSDYLSIPFVPNAGQAMVFASALIGGCIGFLWHNCKPAAMFMGDTGSLALGGAVGLLSTVTRQEILLLLVGGVFVMETVSVMLQVASFKLTGKRIFLCTPIHHHFERLGWQENQIVVRFWILGGIFALMALATLKLR